MQQCRQDAVYEDAIDYENDLDWNGQTFHIKLVNLKTPRVPCGTAILDSEANHKITLLVGEAKLLTPRQIRTYRENLHMPQADLAAALGVAEEIVAHWGE